MRHVEVPNKTLDLKFNISQIACVLHPMLWLCLNAYTAQADVLSETQQSINSHYQYEGLTFDYPSNMQASSRKYRGSPFVLIEGTAGVIILQLYPTGLSRDTVHTQILTSLRKEIAERRGRLNHSRTVVGLRPPSWSENGSTLNYSLNGLDFDTKLYTTAYEERILMLLTISRSEETPKLAAIAEAVANSIKSQSAVSTPSSAATIL